eukprot:jgi/Hompol1/4604/HPOL_003754-RA
MAATASHSFAELFGVTHPSHLPFYDTECPDRVEGGGGEFSTFLPLPIKKNAKPITIKPPPSRVETAAISFINMLTKPKKQKPSSHSRSPSPNSRGEDPASPLALAASIAMPVQDEFAFLDFKKELLPHLLAVQGISPSAYSSSQSKTSANSRSRSPSPSPNADGEVNIRLEDYYPTENMLAIDAMHAALIPSDAQWYMLNQLRIHA